MPKEDEEVWLEREAFMTQFCFNNESEVEYCVTKGMPRRKFDGGKGLGMPRYQYPKNACHRWFAGEGVVL